MRALQNLGHLASGEAAVARAGSKIPQDLRPWVPEAVARIRANGRRRFVETVDLGTNVGVTRCVSTGAADEIVFARERGRDGLSRLVRRRGPEPTSLLTVELQRVRRERAFAVTRVYAGEERAVEPWRPRAGEPEGAFWARHAFVFDLERIVPGTEIADCPSRLGWPIGRLANTEVVGVVSGRRIPQEIMRVLPELLGTLDAPGATDVKVSRNFASPIGSTTCVVTRAGDEIVYAFDSRDRRWKRFVKNREPEPSSLLTVVVGWEAPVGAYVCRYAFLGPRLVAEPRPGASTDAAALAFWTKYAWVWDARRVTPGTEQSHCPW